MARMSMPPSLAYSTHGSGRSAARAPEIASRHRIGMVTQRGSGGIDLPFGSVSRRQHAMLQFGHGKRAVVLSGVILRRECHRTVNRRQVLERLDRVANALARAIGVLHGRLGDQ